MASDGIESALSAVLSATTLDRVGANTSYDAIIVGAGAAGGMAAMLLTESGLRVLVLDAGIPSSRLRAPLRRIVGRVASKLSTQQKLRYLHPAVSQKAREAARVLGRWRQPVQSRCMTWAL